jgi:hypothetical protein
MNKISAVVPVAPWDLLPSKLLFKSLNKYFDPESLDTVFIVYPDKPVMKELLESLDLKFNYSVINEEDIIPVEDYGLFKKRKGWFRQQIVKMYISKRVKTEYYICLDSDNMCIKPTTYHDLIKNGKPGLNMESKDVHSYWWKQSQMVLKLADSHFSVGMSSSTNIFITKEALGLIDYIERIYKKSFSRALLNWFWTNSYIFRRQWTEYKLYWSYIEYRNKIDAYDPTNKILGKSIWKITEHVDEELFKEILNPQNEGYFVVWQSPRVSYELICEKAAQYLGIER